MSGFEVYMRRYKISAYHAFNSLKATEKVTDAQTRPPRRRALEVAPLPPLAPYQRCTCGSCRECLENAKWDRIFSEKFAAKEPEAHSPFHCALNDF